MDMDAQALRLQHGAAKGAGRPLAIGAGDMDHRRQFQMRVAQIAQKAQHPVQRQVDLLGMQRQQARQHRIAAGGCGEGQLAAAAPPLPWRRGMDKTLLRGFACFIRICSTRDRVDRISLRWMTMSSMPCSNRYSARWKPSGSFSRMVWAITRAPVKPICAPGSAIWISPSMA